MVNYVKFYLIILSTVDLPLPIFPSIEINIFGMIFFLGGHNLLYLYLNTINKKNLIIILLIKLINIIISDNLFLFSLFFINRLILYTDIHIILSNGKLLNN
jgi:hypothetical protein